MYYLEDKGSINANMSTYKPTIGIEVHAELSTFSKMFCGCKNDPHASEPNTNICPVCLAHPGTLPTVNKEAVKKVLLVGRAINGELADYSEFDRKQYFYPDIPKAYQLSQYAYPFVKGGELAGVQITRVHLEEDTARSQHDHGDSLVDFNRAGVPLMELVTEPVIHSAEEATLFAKELQLLLRTIGVSEANMEKGEMRVEANISVSKDDTLGTKVEVKNLNSFKVVEQSIKYEVKRQIELLEKGESVKQETRGWDEAKQKTFSQRSKETAQDYRYFPDPDITKYKLSKIDEFNISRLDEIIPEIPSKIRLIFSNLGLTSDQTEILLANSALMNFFKELISVYESGSHKEGLLKTAANYLTSDVVGLMSVNPNLLLHSEYAINFLKLVTMVTEDKITSRAAKDLLTEVVFEGSDPEKLANDRGILQENSLDGLLPIVQQVITENPVVVADYKGGKETAIQFLVGQGMKLSRGAANPGVLLELIKKELS